MQQTEDRLAQEYSFDTGSESVLYYLSRNLSIRSGMSNLTSKVIVSQLFEEIRTHLIVGEVVKLPGIGAFTHNADKGQLTFSPDEEFVSRFLRSRT